MDDDVPWANGIVLDSGSDTIKVGRSGEDNPDVEIRNVFPSSTGEMRYPMERGVVTNWESMEKMWAVAFRELDIDLAIKNVLLTEPLLNPRYNREKMAQIMFESISVQGFYVEIAPLLAGYSSGRNFGIIVDIGEGLTQILPIADGYAVPEGVSRVDLGGRDLTSYLGELVPSFSIGTRLSDRTLQLMKEKCCQVLVDPDAEVGPCSSGEPFELPDGSAIHIGEPGFRCTEALFNPLEHLGLDTPPIPNLVFDSIRRCPIDLRRDFYRNIFLCGGTTLLRGFPERFATEFAKLIPTSTTLRAVAMPDRAQWTWIGGSILTSLTSFQRRWIRRADYDEVGPNIVHQRCNCWTDPHQELDSTE